MRGRTREFSENGRLGAYILCITAIHVFKAADFDCVYKLYTLLMSGRGLTHGLLVT